MYKIIFATIFLLNISTYEIFALPFIIKSELETAKVFLQGAELQHRAEVNITKGMNEIVIEEIADNIDVNSIRVSAKGDAVIMSVNQNYNYMQDKKKPVEIKRLEDSLELVLLKKDKANNRAIAINAVLDLIASNKIFGGKDKTLTVADMKQMSQFYLEQTLEQRNELLNINKEMDELRKEEEKLRNQLNERNIEYNKPVNQVIVKVTANKDTKLILTLNYYTYEAGWTPTYDMRAEDLDKPIQLNYKAEVWQKTGVDWKDINISLSTKDPLVSGNKPILTTQYIDFDYNYGNFSIRGGKPDETTVIVNGKIHSGKTSSGRAGYVGDLSRSNTMIENAYEAQAVEELQDATTGADLTGFTKKQLAVEFSPNIKYTIPSDGKQQTLWLQDYEIKGDYEYYSAPKINGYAYLTTKIKDWEKYNLLPANANIYFGGSFTGKVFVNPRVSDKELVLSLGRDEEIVVTRDILKDFTEDKFLSSDIERIFGYKNVIKNNKAQKVKITIEEQIPVSKNEEIIVKLIEQNGADFEAATGKLKWIIELNSGESKEVKFIFSVRHPVEKKVRTY